MMWFTLSIILFYRLNCIVDASRGDTNPLFIQCTKYFHPLEKQCPDGFPLNQSIWMRLLQWDCEAETSYKYAILFVILRCNA